MFQLSKFEGSITFAGREVRVGYAPAGDSFALLIQGISIEEALDLIRTIDGLQPAADVVVKPATGNGETKPAVAVKPIVKPRTTPVLVKVAPEPTPEPVAVVQVAPEAEPAVTEIIPESVDPEDSPNEVVTSPAEQPVDEADGMPLALAEAQQLRGIVSYFLDRGHTTVEAILAAMAPYKTLHPVLRRAGNLEQRVERCLVSIGSPAA